MMNIQLTLVIISSVIRQEGMMQVSFLFLHLFPKMSAELYSVLGTEHGNGNSFQSTKRQTLHSLLWPVGVIDI